MNKDPVPAVLSMLEAGASVKDTAESLGFTYRSLNRLCRGRLGSTPKKAARLLRFRKALGRIEEVACRGWSEFALDFGFADQAHLIREFQRFSTFTPSELLSMGPGTLHHIPLPE